jgi:hypothetical protein
MSPCRKTWPIVICWACRHDSQHNTTYRPHMYVPQFSFLFHNKIRSCRSQLQCCFLSLCSAVICMSLHKHFQCLQSIVSVRSELLPLLTFIHSTPQTGPLITTHTVSYLLRKSWARHALQGPTSPQNYSATTGIPVPSGQHSPAITTITFPKILPLRGTTNPFLMDYEHHIHTAPPVNPTIK